MMWSFSMQEWPHGQFSRSAVDGPVRQSDRPRTGRAKRHKLIDVIVIAICAVICGADSWVDVEMFGKSKKTWLSRLLELPNGIPSHDTFGRVFARLDPVQFEACFTEWVRAVNEVIEGQVVAIDGKTVHQTGRNQERSFFGHKRHATVRCSWRVDLDTVA